MPGEQANGLQPYQIPIRTAQIVMDESTKYEGAIVEVRLNMPLAQWLAYQKASAVVGVDADEDMAARLRDWTDRFVVRWNLTKEDGSGDAIPATAAGADDVPPDLMNHLFMLWLEAVADVPSPLSKMPDSTDTSAQSKDSEQTVTP